MFFKLQKTTAGPKYHFTLMFVAFSSIWWQCGCASRQMSFSRNSERLNPNLRCPGKNEENIWHSCAYGGYIVENPDPKNCGDRYVCYKGLNEPCSRYDRCADNAICTVCGICQKCDSAENCSDFELCPYFYGFQTLNNAFIKRFIQKPFAEVKNSKF